MKFPSFTRVLPVNNRILESDDKGFKNFKPMDITFIVPCFGVTDNFFPGDVALMFFKEMCLDGTILKMER